MVLFLRNVRLGTYGWIPVLFIDSIWSHDVKLDVSWAGTIGFTSWDDSSHSVGLLIIRGLNKGFP